MTPSNPSPIRKANAEQLKLSKNELSRLANRIDQDFSNAISDHDQRMQRFQRYYQRWRGRTDMPMMGEEETSNFRVPLTQWQVYSKLAKEISSLFGEDAEVVGRPVGPDDQKRVRKVGKFMSWRLFDYMRIQNEATIFDFRKILFGRSIAYAPWKRETYWVPLQDGTDAETVSYDGPSFEPQWPDDIILPAEDARNIHDFSFVIRKARATPDELLRGEAQGRYQGIKENFSRLVNFSSDTRSRDGQSDRMKIEKDAAEGVTYEGNLSAGNSLVVYEWYGKWRMLKGKRDATEFNLDGRDLYETDVMVRYLPALHLIIGVQSLADMYPTKRNRRPFVEAALVEEGSYWSPGFGELLESIEDELSVNHNLATQAGQLSVGPIIFYKPGMGFNPDTFHYEPGMCIASDDPQSVRMMTMTADLQFPLAKENLMVAYAERVTGITDLNSGRSSDRPNAPKTARGTMALLEEGDVRAQLDLSVLREYWGKILTHFWELEGMYGSPETFFRVTEEDAGGLFAVSQGGAYLSEQERSGQYDFDLKFATNAWSKEQNKQNQLALYQIDLQNPLVVNNPRALWVVLDKIHKSFGDDNFSDVIPMPPDLDEPVEPKAEWTKVLEGDEIHVNPMDNDQLHLLDHQKRMEEENKSATPNVAAYNAMVSHVHDHVEAMQQKKIMAALTSALVEKMHGAVSGGVDELHQMQQQAGAPAPQQQQQGPQPMPQAGQ